MTVSFKSEVGILQIGWKCIYLDLLPVPFIGLGSMPQVGPKPPVD